MTYPYSFTGSLGSQYDSRSRYFKEVGRLWQEKEIRHRVKLSCTRQAASDTGLEGEKDDTKIAHRHISGFATFDPAKYERARASFNVSILAEAAQEVQENAGSEKIKPKSVTCNTNALDILASASEVAASADTNGRKKRKHLSEKVDGVKKHYKTKSKKSETKEDRKTPLKSAKQKASIISDEFGSTPSGSEKIKVIEQPGEVRSPKKVESPKLSTVDVTEKAVHLEATEIRRPQTSKISDLLNNDMPINARTARKAPLPRASEDDTKIRLNNWAWSDTDIRDKDRFPTEPKVARQEPRDPISKKVPKSPSAEDPQIRRNSFWSTVRRSSQNEPSSSKAWPYEGDIRRVSQHSSYQAQEGQYGFYSKAETMGQHATVQPPPSLQQHYVPFQKPIFDEASSQEVRYQHPEVRPRANSYSAQQHDIHEQSLKDSWEEGRRRSRELMRYESIYHPRDSHHNSPSSSNFLVDHPQFYEPVRQNRSTYETQSDTRDARAAARYRSGLGYSQPGPFEHEARRPSFPVLHHRSSSYSQDAASAYSSSQSQGQFLDNVGHRSQSVRPHYSSSAVSSPPFSTYPNYGQPYHQPQPEYHPSYQNYSFPPSTTEPTTAQILPPPQPPQQSQLKGYQGSQYGGQAILPANNESRQGWHSGPSPYATPQHSPAFSQLQSINSTAPYSQGSEQAYGSGSGAHSQTAIAQMPAPVPTTGPVFGSGPKRRSRGRGSLPNPEFRRYFGPKQR